MVLKIHRSYCWSDIDEMWRKGWVVELKSHYCHWRFVWLSLDKHCVSCSYQWLRILSCKSQFYSSFDFRFICILELSNIIFCPRCLNWLLSEHFEQNAQSNFRLIWIWNIQRTCIKRYTKDETFRLNGVLINCSFVPGRIDCSTVFIRKISVQNFALIIIIFQLF